MTDFRTGESLLITVEECARHLKLSEIKINELVMSGDWIGARKAGSRYVISRAAFERLYFDGVWHSDEQPKRNPLLVDMTSRKAS